VLLLEHGADPTRRDKAGRSAAAHARATDRLHLEERLHTVADKEETMR
jgi:hypothetical protein